MSDEHDKTLMAHLAVRTAEADQTQALVIELLTMDGAVNSKLLKPIRKYIDCPTREEANEVYEKMTRTERAVMSGLLRIGLHVVLNDIAERWQEEEGE